MKPETFMRRPRSPGFGHSAVETNRLTFPLRETRDWST
jgi:hypothetical protein